MWIFEVNSAKACYFFCVCVCLCMFRASMEVPHERCKITVSFLLTFTLQFAKGKHCVTPNTTFWVGRRVFTARLDTGVAFCRKSVVSTTNVHARLTLGRPRSRLGFELAPLAVTFR